MWATRLKSSVRADTHDALVRELSRFDPIVEIGIGTAPEVAQALATAGVSVTATDVSEQPVPDAVSFVRDDVTNPERAVYREAKAVYALNCPPELHRPIQQLAIEVDATFLFTTLGTDQPTIPVRRQTIPGETLYIATGDIDEKY